MNAKIIIADDDEYQLEFLSRLTKSLRPEWEIVSKLLKIEDVAVAIDELAPDLVLLDVQFPTRNGIDVVKSMGATCDVIFVSGNAFNAVDAFECAALDFILKPVGSERLEMALQRFEVRHKHQLQSTRKTHPEYLRVRRNEEIVMLELQDVLYFQAQHKYTRTVLADEELLLRMSIHEVQEHAPDYFLKSHRSYIINSRKIQSIHRDELNRTLLRMKHRSESVPVSKPHEHMFFREGFFSFDQAIRP